MAEIKWIKILTDIFEDEKIKLIKSMPDGKALIVLWFQLLIQAGKTNAGGWIFLNEDTPYTSKMLSVLFNENQKKIENSLKLFASKGFEMIEIDEFGRIYIPNWEKHQASEKLDKIREDTRKRVAEHRNKKKLNPLDSNVTALLHVTQGNATEIELELELDLELDIDKEKDIKNSSSRNKKTTYSEDHDYYQMSIYLHERIMEYAESINKAHLVENANLQKWADEFRKIVEIDKRDKLELKKVIDWCTKDPFWQPNILSPTKLREKYETLAMKMDTKLVSNNYQTDREKKDQVTYSAIENLMFGGSQ
jgi:predicted phage replisome organizer